MNSTAGSGSVSKASLWTGRIISSVVVLILFFDGITKLLKVQQVVDATIRIGFPVTTIVGIGITLLVCTTIYAIPKTSRSEEHTSELQSHLNLVCSLML